MCRNYGFSNVIGLPDVSDRLNCLKQLFYEKHFQKPVITKMV